MNSALNPEAPEFYPHLTSVTKDGYSTVHKTIRASNHLPIGASYELFKTFTDFNSVSSHLSKNVLVQSNQIVITELPAVKLKGNDDDYNTEIITDLNDRMLDRVNINLDTLSGLNKPDEKFMDGLNPRKIDAFSKLQNKPVIAKIRVGSTTFIGAKNILRPQLTFKDTIDNSDSLWVPKISDKPNNIKPLALNILYNDEGEAVGYEHPYQVELDLYNPPAEFTDPDPEPPTFPAPLSSTPFTFIETEAQVDDLVKHLEGVKELAVDLEHHSYRTYQGITCLIQITTHEGDFVIDALAVREHIYKLNQAFTDPRKIKVFHGADWDVLWLQRDFGVYVVGLFDTFQAAKALSFNGLSLKYLLLKYCGVNADKKYQLADWRIRPLPSELMEYARMDTHYLLYIWRQLKAELLEAGGGQLQQVLDLSRQIAMQTYRKEVVDDNSHTRLYVRSKKSFNTQQLAALQLLYKWRDAQARALDESTMYLLPNHMLLTLAETLPREVQGVNAICSPMPPFVKQNLITIHRMILSCRELPMEPQLYQMPTSLRQMVTQTHVTYNVHDLTHLPDFREDQINLDKAGEILAEFPAMAPEVPAFRPHSNGEIYNGVVSALNVDAQLFIPPYDRYRKYRTLAQLEEIKAFKDQESKMAKISKLAAGNELIKQEVLNKIQQAKTQVENSENKTDDTELTKKQEEKKTDDKNGVQKRKRKISDKVERKDAVAQIAEKVEMKAKNVKVQAKDKGSKNIYNSVDYTKFFEANERPGKANKQPKMKFKKHK